MLFVCTSYGSAKGAKFIFNHKYLRMNHLGTGEKKFSIIFLYSSRAMFSFFFFKFITISTYKELFEKERFETLSRVRSFVSRAFLDLVLRVSFFFPALSSSFLFYPRLDRTQRFVPVILPPNEDESREIFYSRRQAEPFFT